MYKTPMYVNRVSNVEFFSINKAPNPTVTPSKNHPITIPEIRGSVLLNPNFEEWTAERRLLGPGKKETGNVKTSIAIKFEKSIIRKTSQILDGTYFQK